MNQVKAGINYKETYFQFKELTKIHGEPNYDSIKRLHNQVKANAFSVPSVLGGGNFGHLGLVVTPQKYAMISNAPFNRTNHPGPCVFPANSTQAQIQAIRDTHTEQIRIFNEVLGVEAALRQQINDAVEESYLKAIRNRESNAIIMPVSDIFQLHLYPNYGEVDSFKLEEEREKVVQMNYDTTYPPDGVYETIENLMDMAEASVVPFTQHQAMNMGLQILVRTRQFDTDLKEWFKKPAPQRTWITFKRHFIEAYKVFKKFSNADLGSTVQFQQANIIKQMIQTTLEEMVQEANSPTDAAPPETFTTPALPALAPPTVDHAAHAAVANTNQQLAKEVQELKAMVYALQLQKQCTPVAPAPSASSKGKRLQSKPWAYCHTHGFCKHAGTDCTNKGPNHKDEATFFDIMGGSNKGFENWKKAIGANT